MEQQQQQQQGVLFGPAPKPTTMRSRPRVEAFDHGRAAKPDPRLDSAGLFDATKSGGQLPMFMSAREIAKNYRIIDGDRLSMPTRDGTGRLRLENDDEVMERKHTEASMFKHPEIHGSGLAKRLHDDNYQVEEPIPLQVPSGGRFHTDVGPFQRGMPGDPRPTTLDGGHRIAVMRFNAPDRPMPVEHHDMDMPPAPPSEIEGAQARVNQYQQERRQIMAENGEIRIGNASVPQPFHQDEVIRTSGGIYPAGTSSRVGLQLEAAHAAAVDDVRVLKKRHEAKRNALHHFLKSVLGS